MSTPYYSCYATMMLGTSTRPPMLLLGSYTLWAFRFKAWLTHFDDDAYMLNSIRNGPYVMKQIADPSHPAFTKNQTQDDLSDDELK